MLLSYACGRLRLHVRRVNLAQEMKTELWYQASKSALSVQISTEIVITFTCHVNSCYRRCQCHFSEPAVSQTKYRQGEALGSAMVNGHVF